jgi:hypothetical protein
VGVPTRRNFPGRPISEAQACGWLRDASDFPSFPEPKNSFECEQRRLQALALKSEIAADLRDGTRVPCGD